MHHPESGRPQIVAHRGASAELPEHTLAAYVAALDQGAEGLECDVRLTSDHELVCIHDRTVDRTSNGSGVVSSMTLAELSALDFSSWKSGPSTQRTEKPDDVGNGVGVLTARHLLELVKDCDRPVDLAIETKHPTRFGPLVERRLAALLTEFGMHTADSSVRVMSFSPASVVRAKRLLPEVETVLLFDRPSRLPLVRALPRRGWIAGPGLALLRARPDIGRKLAESGRRTHVWTANTEADWDLLCELGVEAIITDRPGAALDHLVGSGRRFSG